MNRKSRHRSNIGYTRHTKKTNKTGKHSTAYKAKRRMMQEKGYIVCLYTLLMASI